MQNFKSLSNLVKYNARYVKKHKSFENFKEDKIGYNPLKSPQFQKTAEYFKNSDFDQKLDQYIQQKMDQGQDIQQLMDQLMQAQRNQLSGNKNKKQSNDNADISNLIDKDLASNFTQEFQKMAQNNPEFNSQLEQMKNQMNLPTDEQFSQYFEQFQQESMQKEKSNASYKGQNNQEVKKNKRK
ncbi:hypothetical protein PPERSA_10805 [Pseudocohnilembus persalinus]|uniref:Uncharacterized protein n=1 Tax=Pseudocohnilembus persalinus TaxID=266149 RepID=A0A0V0QDP4_PSEPJ|nr:hypothetical protein PPERSA_10805 [Pseudocohnilembus persalinus]|eukprot:KRX00306.1 hypothetical protein PPERSA_10805 [Pseudocohnilembus persalinus]